MLSDVGKCFSNRPIAFLGQSPRYVYPKQSFYDMHARYAIINGPIKKSKTFIKLNFYYIYKIP